MRDLLRALPYILRFYWRRTLGRRIVYVHAQGQPFRGRLVLL